MSSLGDRLSRFRKYCYPVEQSEIDREIRENKKYLLRAEKEEEEENEEDIVRGSGSGNDWRSAQPQDSGPDVYSNRRMIVETRRKVAVIDERTAFIARMVLMLVSSFVLAVGAGLVVAFAV